MTLSLEPHDVHVRYLLIDGFSEEGYARAFEVLSADERARAERFVFARDRVIFVASHALLRHALSAYEDVAPAAWRFGQEGAGKPRLAAAHAATSLRFNLAHTRGLVACAIARGIEVGVDVESLEARATALDIARRFFSPHEVAHLEACPEADRHARFIEIWTLKEAYIKAIGQGLAHPLHTFSFLFGEGTVLHFEPPADETTHGTRVEDGPNWQFSLFAPSPAHRMTVAVRCPPRQTCRITAWVQPSGEAMAASEAIVSDRRPMYTFAVQPEG
jgi:4'-phosphopantetheinyl transferase